MDAVLQHLILAFWNTQAEIVLKSKSQTLLKFSEALFADAAIKGRGVVFNIGSWQSLSATRAVIPVSFATSKSLQKFGTALSSSSSYSSSSLSSSSSSMSKHLELTNMTSGLGWMGDVGLLLAIVVDENFAF